MGMVVRHDMAVLSAIFTFYLFWRSRGSLLAVFRPSLFLIGMGLLFTTLTINIFNLWQEGTVGPTLLLIVGGVTIAVMLPAGVMLFLAAHRVSKDPPVIPLEKRRRLLLEIGSIGILLLVYYIVTRYLL